MPTVLKHQLTRTGTGLISTWFVEDLLVERETAKAKHVIQAIGASSLEKAREFARKMVPNGSPQTYGSYEAVYQDSQVDVVYIGTPHSMHKQNCLDAIEAGKNVFCEKAFTINTPETLEVLETAKRKGVYVAEAMWLRHRPLVYELQKLLHHDKVIGNVFRMSSDFGLLIDIAKLPMTSRYKDPALGAGTLLDIGIYPLTWAILTLEPAPPGLSSRSSDIPKVFAAQDFDGPVEVTTTVLVHYPETGRQGVISSTTMANGGPDVVCRIEGTNGFIEVEGPAPSLPLSFTVYPPLKGDPNSGKIRKPEGKKYMFEQIGRGFMYEADSVALDLAAGRKESAAMPWNETIRVMRILDEIRRQGGTKYPQDKE